MKKSILAITIATACISSSSVYAYNTRIIGGSEASSGAYPWMTSLRKEGRQFCGASLIAPNWVVTAAHCVTGESAANLEAVIGDYDLSKDDVGEIKKRISKIVSHPKYDETTNNFDVALLKLESPVVSSVAIPATSAINDAVTTGTMLTVMGWGNLSTTGESFPNILHELKVPLVSAEQCSKNYTGITSNMMCAGLAEGGKDSCQGDSGGPLLQQINGAWHQLGVVSFGEGCAQPNKPGVYAKMSAFSSWVANVQAGNVNETPEPDTTDPEVDTDDPEINDDLDNPNELIQSFNLPYWLDFFALNEMPEEHVLEFVNTTESAVSVDLVTIDQPTFNVSSNNCSGLLDAGSKCEIKVAYTPSESKQIDEANLQLIISDGSTIDIELVGENLVALFESDDASIDDNAMMDWYGSEDDWANSDDGFSLSCDQIVNGETATLEVEVEGPGTLEFDFSLPDDARKNSLVYRVDGKVVRTITGGQRTNNQHQTELTEGKHNVSWMYQKREASNGTAKVSNVKFSAKTSTSSSTTTKSGGGSNSPLMLISLLSLMGLRRLLKK